MKIKLCNWLRPLALGAALFCSFVHAEVVPLDRVVTIVDNDVIMQNQLDQCLREVYQALLRRGAPLPPEHVLIQQMLERLVIENIQQQIGDRSGIRISDEELNQAMGTIAQRSGMSLEQLQAALTRDGLFYADAHEQVRREMVISRVCQRRVVECIQVSEQEVKNFLVPDTGKIQLSEKYRLASILIPVPEAASSGVIQVAARQTQEPYQQLEQGADFGQLVISYSAGDNALEGGEIGRRKAAQLPWPSDSMIGSLVVSDVTEPVRTPGGFIILELEEKRGGSKMVRDEVHTRHILLKSSEIRNEAEIEKLAQKLYERTQPGEDFGELVKSFSEDPGSAPNGGDLNWVDPEALVPEFCQAMNDNPQGESSKPLRSQFGWHILQILGRHAIDSNERFHEQQAVSVLRNRKYDEELQTWLWQIRDETYVETKQ